MRRVPLIVALGAMVALCVGCGGGGGVGPKPPTLNFYDRFVPGATWVYNTTLPTDSDDVETQRIIGAQDVGGISCLNVEDSLVGTNGTSVINFYLTVSEANVGLVFGDQYPGESLFTYTPPYRRFPQNPPRDFSTTTTGSDNIQFIVRGVILSAAADVTVPAGHYANAVLVERTWVDPADNTVIEKKREWIVPNIGMVKWTTIDPATDQPTLTRELASFSPAAAGQVAAHRSPTGKKLGRKQAHFGLR